MVVAVAFAAGRIPRRSSAQVPKVFLSLVEGDAQSPTAGTTAATPPKVRATTGPGGAGSPVVGAIIVWTTTDDSRVSSGGAFAASAVSVTDASGYAVINWRMGNAIGLYALTATIRGGPSGASPITFGATAIADVLAHLVPLSAQSQPGTVAAPVADPPSVQATDPLGNPIASQAVTGVITGGGGSGTTLSGTTDANGVFTVGGWTLGSSIGVNTLVLTAGAFSVTFIATSAAGAATQLAKISGDTQSQTVNASLPLPLVVEVRDNSNQPVAGEPVTFHLVGPGTVDTTVVVNSDAAGRAQYTPALDTKVGANTVTASILNATVAQVFTATGTVGAAAKLAFVAQPPSQGTSGSDLPGTATVEVTDTFGNRRTADNSTVVTLGVNSGSASLPATTATASAGLASFPTIVLTGAGQVVLQATSGALQLGLSNAISLAPPVAAVFTFGVQPSNVVAGQTIAPAIQVRVEDGGGTLISSDNGRPVTLTINANPGSSVLSGTLTQPTVNGIATFADISLDQVAVNYKLAAGDGVLTSAVSNFFNVVVAGTVYTQEPVGMTKLHEFFHDKTFAEMGTNTMHTIPGVFGQSYVSGNYRNLKRDLGIDDTTAPFGVNQVGRTRGTQGQTYNGVSFDNTGHWSGPLGTGGYYNEIYTCCVMKVVGTPKFEANALGSKMWYWHSGHSAQTAINIFFLVNATSVQQPVDRFRLELRQQGGANPNVMGQVNWSQNNGFNGQDLILVNRWYKIQAYGRISTLGAEVQQANGTWRADGLLKVWLSEYDPATGLWGADSLIMNYSTLCYRRNVTGGDKAFGFHYWASVYGGGSTIPLSQNDDIYRARNYASAKF